MTLTAPSPLEPTQVERFFDEGYLLVPGVLSPQEVATYARAVLALVPRDLCVPADWQAHDARFKPYRRLPDGSRDDCIDTPELLPLICNRRLYEVAAQLLGSPHLRVFDGSVGITMRNLAHPETPRSQRLHIDASVPREAGQFLFTPEELQVGGCYYLTDVEPDGGGIHVVPGGHRFVEATARRDERGRQLHGRWGDIPGLESVEVTGRAGDFAMLHHLMPHGAAHNRLPQTRLAVFVRYVRVDHPWGDPKLFTRSYNDAQLAVIDPLGRKLLGLDGWD
jgi:ectoine hydroxylase-related dioxygenase (phytanoyl-CoA dioxygenase family)